MIQLDPVIMRRSLPPHIHSTIDQVTANVNQVVDEIVNKFVRKANQAAEQFEKAQFTPAIQQALEQEKAKLESDIAQWTDKLASLKKSADEAKRLASNAGEKGAAIEKKIGEILADAEALQTQLTQFRTKLDTFAEKSGGLIASTAVKTFTGGLA